MKNFSLTFFCMIFFFSLYGQTVEEKVNREISQLQKEKVDTFLIYELYCNGGIIELDSCKYENEQYLFWRRDTNYYFKKFTSCDVLQTVLLDNDNPLSYYLANINTINKETIRPPEFIKSNKGGKKIIETINIDHTCFYEITFILHGKKKTKSVSDFNWTCEKFDNGNPNSNYKINQRTKLSKLVERLKQLTDN